MRWRLRRVWVANWDIQGAPTDCDTLQWKPIEIRKCSSRIPTTRTNPKPKNRKESVLEFSYSARKEEMTKMWEGKMEGQQLGEVESESQESFYKGVWGLRFLIARCCIVWGWLSLWYTFRMREEEFKSAQTVHNRGARRRTRFERGARRRTWFESGLGGQITWRSFIGAVQPVPLLLSRRTETRTSSCSPDSSDHLQISTSLENHLGPPNRSHWRKQRISWPSKFQKSGWTVNIHSPMIPSIEVKVANDDG